MVIMRKVSRNLLNEHLFFSVGDSCKKIFESFFKACIFGYVPLFFCLEKSGEQVTSKLRRLPKTADFGTVATKSPVYLPKNGTF